MIYIYVNVALNFQFAADFTEKTLFKTMMVRLLKAALAENEENLAVMMTEEILNVDEQLLQVEKVTKEVSGRALTFASFIILSFSWTVTFLV